MKIGKKLREKRKEKDITLQELSKKSGVALATLSRIENNKMTGTIDSHLRICRTLGISITELYGQFEEDTKVLEKYHPSKKIEHYKQSDNADYHLLVPKLGEKKIRPFLVKIGPDGKTDVDKSTPGVEKFVYLIKGELLGKIGKTEYNLKKGDSLYFDASLDNIFINKSKREAELMVVVTPPGTN